MPARRKNTLRTLTGNDLKVFNEQKLMISNLSPSTLHFLFDQRSEELTDIPADCSAKDLITLFNFTDFLQTTYPIISSSPFYDQEKLSSFNVANTDFKHINKKLVHRNSSGKAYIKKFKDTYLEIRSLMQEFDFSIFLDIFSNARSNAMNILNRNYLLEKENEKQDPKTEILYQKVTASRRSMGICMSVMIHGLSIYSIVSLNESINEQFSIIKEFLTLSRYTRETEIKMTECFNQMIDVLIYLKEQFILGIFSCVLDQILDIPVNSKLLNFEIYPNPNADLIELFKINCEPLTPFLESFVKFQNIIMKEIERNELVNIIDEFTNYAQKFPDYFLSGSIFELYVDIRILQIYTARVHVVFGTNQTTDAIFKLYSTLQSAFKFFFTLRTNEIAIDGINVLITSIGEIIDSLNDDRKKIGDYYIMGFLRIDEFRIHLHKIIENLKKINYTICVIHQFNRVNALLHQKEDVLSFGLSFFRPLKFNLFGEAPPMQLKCTISMKPIIQSLVDSLSEYGIEITYDENFNNINIPNIDKIYTSLLEAGIEIDPMSEDETFQLLYRKHVAALKSDFISIHDSTDHDMYINLKILHQIHILFLAFDYIGALDYSTAVRYTYARAYITSFFKKDLLENAKFTSDLKTILNEKLTQEYNQYAVHLDPKQITSLVIQVQGRVNQMLHSLEQIKGCEKELLVELFHFTIQQPTMELIDRILELINQSQINIDDIKIMLLDLKERMSKARNPGKVQKFILSFLNYIQGTSDKSKTESNAYESLLPIWVAAAQECMDIGAIYCDIDLLKAGYPEVGVFNSGLNISLDIYINKIMIELNQICRVENCENIVILFERLTQGAFEITEICNLLLVLSENEFSEKLITIMNQFIAIIQFFCIYDNVFLDESNCGQTIRRFNYKNFTSTYASESLYLASSLSLPPDCTTTIKQCCNDIKRLSKKINIIGTTPEFIFEHIEHLLTQIKLKEESIDYLPILQSIHSTIETIAPNLISDIEEISKELANFKIPKEKLLEFKDTISLLHSENDDSVSYIISSLNTILLSINKRMSYITFIRFSMNSELKYIELEPIFVIAHDNYSNYEDQLSSSELIPLQHAFDTMNKEFDQFNLINQSSKINEMIQSIKIPESSFEIPTELLPIEIQEKYFQLLIELREQKDEKFQKIAASVKTSSLTQKYHSLYQQVNQLEKHNKESVEKIREIYDQYNSSTKRGNDELIELIRQYEFLTREDSLNQKELENKNSIILKEIEEKQDILDRLICSNRSLDLSNREIEELLKSRRLPDDNFPSVSSSNKKKESEKKKNVSDHQAKPLKKDTTMMDTKEFSGPSKIPMSLKHIVGPNIQFNAQQADLVKRLSEQLVPKGHSKKEVIPDKSIDTSVQDDNYQYLRLIEEDRKRRRDNCLSIVSMIQMQRQDQKV